MHNNKVDNFGNKGKFVTLGKGYLDFHSKCQHQGLG